MFLFFSEAVGLVYPHQRIADLCLVARQDSAYDAPEIKQKSRALGHVPIIDKNPRSARGKAEMAAEARGRQIAGYTLAEEVHYNERSARRAR